MKSGEKIKEKIINALKGSWYNYIQSSSQNLNLFYVQDIY